MHWEQQIQYASMSDIGLRRRNNQDTCVVQICGDRKSWAEHGHLLMVADGMGGHAVGELASKIAGDTLPHTFFKTRDMVLPDALKASIEAANAAIYERGSQNLEFQRMGTTCSALVLSPLGAIVGHVGDSRVYRIRNDFIDQLTCDHSLQWELLKQGKLGPEEIYLHHPRNVITRSLGPEATVEVDIEGPHSIRPGDIYVLCSDGLTGHVSDTEIGIIANELPCGEACRLLVNLANLKGGNDNITVVIAKVGEVPHRLSAVAPEDMIDNKIDRESRWSLLGIAAAATFFAAGACLALLDHVTTGAILASVSTIAGAVIGWMWWRAERQRQIRDEAIGEKVKQDAYRSTTAKFSRKFLNLLAQIESELQQAAIDEGWSIDWTNHDSAYRTAKTALENDQTSLALKGFANAIDALMVGVQSHRRQAQHDAKWGKSPQQSAKNGTMPDNGAAATTSQPNRQ